MLSLVPADNYAVITRDILPVSPQEITISYFNSNFTNLESQLVLLNNVRFAIPSGTFEPNRIYFMNDGQHHIRFRTSFQKADYIGARIPEESGRIKGIVTQNNGMGFITPRNIEDFIDFILSDYDVEVVLLYNRLIGNYPNPFNPETTIMFSTAHEGFVCINIYNIRGQRVRGLISEVRGQGNHTVIWDGRNDAGNLVGSGVYFYQMRTGCFVANRRMLLLK
jgi:hypothetical protein